MCHKTNVSSKLIMLLLAAGLAGCKKEAPPAPPPPVEAPDTRLAAAAPAVPEGTEAYELAPGERLWDGKAEDTRTVWKPKDKGDIELYVVRLKDGEDGDARGMLRARHGSKRQDVLVLAFGKGTPTANLKTLPSGRALFWYAPAADRSENNSLRVMLLGYDEATEQVLVYKSWSGRADGKIPAWAEGGEFKVDDKALSACEKVAKRIASCAKDAGFKEAVFRRESADERSKAESDLVARSGKWKGAKALRAQCQDWSSDAYQETHLSDPEELAELAKDTALDCTLFGRELDDEGGLPRRSQPAAKEKK